MLPHVARWLLLSGLVSALAGSALAYSPGAHYRDEYPRGEPLAHLAAAVAGFCVGWVYLRIGTSVEGGVRAGGMLWV
ncbi:hypothetical protein AX768_11860 [Burkholderia sp. PAMC 28687]|nr:hypothetical protein AX768_11860 [Burkholderia sp. PAMC 28687]